MSENYVQISFKYLPWLKLQIQISGWCKFCRRVSLRDGHFCDLQNGEDYTELIRQFKTKFCRDSKSVSSDRRQKCDCALYLWNVKAGTDKIQRTLGVLWPWVSISLNYNSWEKKWSIDGREPFITEADEFRVPFCTGVVSLFAIDEIFKVYNRASSRFYVLEFSRYNNIPL